MSYCYYNDINNINFGIARKKIKEHGTKNLIEGNIDKNKSIILVEDVITTGNSILEVAKNLTVNGYSIFAIVAVVDRSENDEIDLKYEFNFYSLLTVKDIKGIKDK